MENKELENWLEETKAKNFNYNELVSYLMASSTCPKKIWDLLDGIDSHRKGEILFNQWQKEKEFSPKRGDRVLVWDLFEEKAVEKIFLTEIKGCITPIKVVGEGSEIEFENNEIFISEGYKFMKPLPTEQPKETDFKSQVIELIRDRIAIANNNLYDAVQNNLYDEAAIFQKDSQKLVDLLNEIIKLC